MKIGSRQTSRKILTFCFLEFDESENNISNQDEMKAVIRGHPSWCSHHDPKVISISTLTAHLKAEPQEVTPKTQMARNNQTQRKRDKEEKNSTKM